MTRFYLRGDVSHLYKNLNFLPPSFMETWTVKVSYNQDTEDIGTVTATHLVAGVPDGSFSCVLKLKDSAEINKFVTRAKASVLRDTQKITSSDRIATAIETLINS